MAGRVSQYQQNYEAALQQKRDEATKNNYRNFIRSLQEKPKRDSLKDAPVRGDLTSRKKIGKRVNASAGDQGEFIEISRTFYTTLRELRSSDGLFVLQYYNVNNIFMNRATFTYKDYDPDAP